MISRETLFGYLTCFSIELVELFLSAIFGGQQEVPTHKLQDLPDLDIFFKLDLFVEP